MLVLKAFGFKKKNVSEFSLEGLFVSMCSASFCGKLLMFLHYNAKYACQQGYFQIESDLHY